MVREKLGENKYFLRWGKNQGKSLILCQLGITQRILLRCTQNPGNGKVWKVKTGILMVCKRNRSKCKHGLFVNINQLMQGQ